MFKLIKKLLLKIRLLLLSKDVVHYICTGANVLPEKLTCQEELKLVADMSNGDSKAKKELIERNLRLVVYTAQKFDNTGVNIEDLISVGTIGLIKAVGSFNGNKQIKMATYASRCIENEILMFLRKTVKAKKEVSLDDPLNMDSDGNELKLADCLGTASDEVSQNYDQNIEKEILKKALSTLNEREMLIMNMRFGLENDHEMTQKEVADKLNISQSYISRLEKKIIERLKKEMLKLA